MPGVHCMEQLLEEGWSAALRRGLTPSACAAGSPPRPGPAPPRPAHPTQGHFERPPYNAGSMRSAYHVRELEVHRLLRLRQPLDVFLSHDWPQVGSSVRGSVQLAACPAACS